MTTTSVSPKPESVSANAKPRLSHVWTREGSDFYIEPHWVSARLFAVEDFDRAEVLLDPCTGTGRVADSAKAAGYTTVIAADIVNRGYPGAEIQNFLERTSVPPSVVGNPPFNAVEAFATHALDLGARKVALIFPTARLNAARWLQDLPLRKILLLTPRPSMPPSPLRPVTTAGETRLAQQPLRQNARKPVAT